MPTFGIEPATGHGSLYTNTISHEIYESDRWIRNVVSEAGEAILLVNGANCYGVTDARWMSHTVAEKLVPGCDKGRHTICTKLLDPPCQGRLPIAVCLEMPSTEAHVDCNNVVASSGCDVVQHLCVQELERASLR
jgi:hypothetical protein